MCRTCRAVHIQVPTIQTYEGPQGPGTMFLKSGTVPEIQGPLRPAELAVNQQRLAYSAPIEPVVCGWAMKLTIAFQGDRSLYAQSPDPSAFFRAKGVLRD